MKAIISEKGQVTIPKELRDRLGLRPGQTIEFEARNGTLIARKAPSKNMEAVVGILKGKVSSVDAYLEESRGPGLKR